MERIKSITWLAFGIIISYFSVSCSDDYLNYNYREVYDIYDTIFLYNYQDQVEIKARLPVSVSSEYSVYIYPKWLSFKSMLGKTVDGFIPMNVTLRKENLSTDYQMTYGLVYLDIKDVGLAIFNVAYSNFGYPVAECSTSSLNFESLDTKTFSIKNSSEGILKWRIKDKPEWLNLSQTSGSLAAGDSSTLSASLDIFKVQQRIAISDKIHIINNSSINNIPIKVGFSAKSLITSDSIKISGKYIDADISRKSGIMAICTEAPNTLVIYNTNNEGFKTIQLSKTPKCVSISEDGKKVSIGYSDPYVGFIDTESGGPLRDFPIDCVPFDIVMGENHWCYYTAWLGGWTYLRNLNLTTGEVIPGKGRVFQQTMIKKVPSKNYLAGIQTSLSPTELLLFDISEGKANDSISNYFVDLKEFWLSNDGGRIYNRSGKVFMFPEFKPSNPGPDLPIVGKFDTSENNVWGFDDFPELNSFYVISRIPNAYPYKPSEIIQYNSVSLRSTRKFEVLPVLITTSPSNFVAITTPEFIFVNRKLSKLFIVKSLGYSYIFIDILKLSPEPTTKTN